MLKVALFAATLLLAGPAALAADGFADSAAAPAVPASCHPGQSLDLGCAMRAVDADGDGSISAAELANLAVPPPPANDWTPLHTTHGTGLDFKDAATEPVSLLHAAPDRDGPRLLVPTLFAIGALVILLRKRPT
jgi:hypothetical protein